MHDARMLREQVDLLRDGLRRRGALDGLAPVIDRGIQLERDRRTLIQAVEERKAARNANSQEVARRKRAKEDADELIAQGRSLGDEITKLEHELAAAQRDLDQTLLEIPNVTLPTVPEGDETHNVIAREWGSPRARDGVKPHWEIGASLGMIDLERGGRSPARDSFFTVASGRGSSARSSRCSWTRTARSTATRRSGPRYSSIARR